MVGVPSVAAFTDTYLPTVNGVSYTVRTWRDRWRRRGGRMAVVYPDADGYRPKEGEHPVRSLPFPFYEGYRIGSPTVPDAVDGTDVVHGHTPFLLGIAAWRYARRADAPLVASYHTPTTEYASYLADGVLSAPVERVTRAQERWFLNRADAVVVPSVHTREHLDGMEVSTPVEVVPNGVDIETFRPTDAADFRERHDVPDGPVVGYTGRHGYEKNLGEVVEATDGTDVTLLFGGDGPARADLEARADAADVDARFLGFLDREELPAFYSALDAFAFPSPIETQGLVALEANACGTPVVAADAGALADTVVDGETGYHYRLGHPEDLREKLERVLAETDDLRSRCVDHAAELSVERAVDRLAVVYEDVLGE